MRQEIVDALQELAPVAVRKQMQALVPVHGNIVEQLIALGLPGRDVLDAAAGVTGAPLAPQVWLKKPNVPAIDNLDTALLRRLQAAPVASVAGRLCIAFADPQLAVGSADLGLPQHTAYLALPDDVKVALRALPVADDGPKTRIERPDASDEDPFEAATIQAPSPKARLKSAAPKAEPTNTTNTDDDDDTQRELKVPVSKPKADPDAAVPFLADDVADDAATVVAPAGFADALRKRVKAGFEEITNAGLRLSQLREEITNGGHRLRSVLTDTEQKQHAEATPFDEPTVSRHEKPNKDDDDGDSATMQVPMPASLPASLRVRAMIDAVEAVDDKRGHSLPPPPMMTESQAPRLVDTMDVATNAAFDVRDVLRRYEAEASQHKSDEDDPLFSALPAPRTSPSVAEVSAADVLPASEEAEFFEPEEQADAPQAPARTRTPKPKPIAGTKNEAEAQRFFRLGRLEALKRYQFERVIGRGGMATVLLATDAVTNQQVAVKVMEQQLAEDEAFVERFRREVRAQESITHDNVIRLLGAGNEGDTYFMVSEYVDAGTVFSLHKAMRGPMPAALAIPIVCGVLRGLSAAHKAGIIHRDVKPANFMLTSTGVVKVGDFGIGKSHSDATLTKTGALFGTPAYMSPEQAQGFGLDGRSDLYAVGIVMYELLAGKNPFVGDGPADTMMNIARGKKQSIYALNPTVPALAADVIDGLLARDRERRIATADEAVELLAPLEGLVERRARGALVRALQNPVPTKQELFQQEAVLHVAHAWHALEKSPPEPGEAAYRYFCASLLDANNADASTGKSEMEREYDFVFDKPVDAEFRALEAEMWDLPSATLARRLVDMASEHHALIDVLRFAREGLTHNPNDVQLQHRLERVVGPDACAPFNAPNDSPIPRAHFVLQRVAAIPPPVSNPGDASFDAVAAAAADEDMPREVAFTPSGGVSRPAPVKGRRIRERSRGPGETSQPSTPSPRPAQASFASLDPALAPERPAAPAPAPRPKPKTKTEVKGAQPAEEGPNMILVAAIGGVVLFVVLAAVFLS